MRHTWLRGQRQKGLPAVVICRFTPRQLEALVAVHTALGFGAAAQRPSLIDATK